MNFEKNEILKESGMENLIQELEAKTKYERMKQPDGKEIIKSPEGEEYSVRLLTDENDPVVEKLHEYMLTTFGEEETIPLSWLRKTISGNKDQNFVVEDSEGKIAAYMQSEYLAIGDNETMIFSCYTEVNKNFAKKALGPELRLSAYKTYDEMAKNNNQKILGIVTEAMPQASGFASRLGYKRAYYEDTEGNLKQVPYFCPPIDYSSETGERMEEPVPENLTMRLADGSNTINVAKLLKIVEAIYDKYVDTPDNYHTREAYETAYKDAMGILEDLRKEINQTRDGRIYLMTPAEHKERIQKEESFDQIL